MSITLFFTDASGNTCVWRASNAQRDGRLDGARIFANEKSCNAGNVSAYKDDGGGHTLYEQMSNGMTKLSPRVINLKGWHLKIMSTEKDQRAGGDAKTKNVEEVRRGGGDGQTKDVEEVRGGGDAQTKDVEEVRRGGGDGQTKSA